jgi:hypothetical protein
MKNFFLLTQSLNDKVEAFDTSSTLPNNFFSKFPSNLGKTKLNFFNYAAYIEADGISTLRESPLNILSQMLPSFMQQFSLNFFGEISNSDIILIIPLN